MTVLIYSYCIINYSNKNFWIVWLRVPLVRIPMTNEDWQRFFFLNKSYQALSELENMCHNCIASRYKTKPAVNQQMGFTNSGKIFLLYWRGKKTPEVLHRLGDPKTKFFEQYPLTKGVGQLSCSENFSSCAKRICCGKIKNQ